MTIDFTEWTDAQLDAANTPRQKGTPMTTNAKTTEQCIEDYVMALVGVDDEALLNRIGVFEQALGDCHNDRVRREFRGTLQLLYTEASTRGLI